MFETKKIIKLISAILVVGFCVVGCVEPFDAKTDVFENALVVDALLTTELKQHSVTLFRTYTFEADGPAAEQNARVEIEDNAGNTYRFSESEPGIYLSETSFAARTGSSYTLHVETTDGKSYRSTTVTTPENVPIENVTAKRLVNDEGEEGVSILLDNSSTSGKPNYFRFEYDETYKIIAPNYDPFEFEVVHYIACDTIPYQVDIKPRIEEQRVCFGTATSNKLIQTSTVGLTENKVDDFSVRFINRDDYIMSHRYSLMVRQFTQTQDAYSYYERLGDFSSSDNIFSQIQPGFLEGNVRSATNKDENVLGYFEVAAVNEKRMYFNYADLFPDEPLPPYAINCATPGNPQLYSRGYHCASFRVCDGACESPLIEAILAGIVVFNSVNETPSEDKPGPYFTLPSPCGDCTKLGSNVVPDFWEE